MNEQFAPSSMISISDLTLKFADSDKDVVHKLSMEIVTQGWTCLLGTSGSGKTTLLKYLAGILNNDIYSFGNITHPYKTSLPTNIAYMAQQDILLPWLNIIENVLLPFRFTGQHKSQENRDKAIALLEMVGLIDNYKSNPEQLSGGMRQRVALARTLIQDKPIVLMDEPFSALDAVTRYRLQDLAVSLLQDKAVFLITHDPLEAIKLANNLYILHDSPSRAQKLELPSVNPPRELNSSTGALHNKIVHILEGHL